MRWRHFLPVPEEQVSLKAMLSVVVLLWITVPLIVVWYYGMPSSPNDFVNYFVPAGTLFTGLGFLAILWQTKQQSEGTRQQLLEIITQNESLLHDVRVSALRSLIKAEQDRIETLTQWGEQQGDPRKYRTGIDKCHDRILQYTSEIRSIEAELKKVVAARSELVF